MFPQYKNIQIKDYCCIKSFETMCGIGKQLGRYLYQYTYGSNLFYHLKCLKTTSSHFYCLSTIQSTYLSAWFKYSSA